MAQQTEFNVTAISSGAAAHGNLADDGDTPAKDNAMGAAKQAQ